MISSAGLEGTFLYWMDNPGECPNSVKPENFSCVYDQGNRDLGDAASSHYLMNG